MKRILQQFELLNRHYALLKKGDRVLVALSGGPDSVALLWLLKALERKYSLKIFCVHLNHGLQPAAQKDFARVAQENAAKAGCPFLMEQINVRDLARAEGRSLEEAGRHARYRFFAQCAEKVRANKIATAHTLDDQAETVLMRLSRGAGLRGLTAIAFSRREGHQEIIRPLLYTKKDELLRFLKAKRLKYIWDPSNRSMDYFRNRVRHNVLPHLRRTLNPRMDEMLAGFQEVALEAQDYIEQMARRTFRRMTGVSGGDKKRRRAIRLRVKALLRLHPAILSEVLFLSVQALCGHRRRIGLKNIRAITDLLQSPRKGASVRLPGQIEVRLLGKELHFTGCGPAG